MEIPYIFTPRKDTGLVNSKIAIWLFLASEVMLFGGFFSSYVYLRLGADFPWPERALPVLPGLINTFVLIASSVTVVFAWAAIKLRKWRMFQVMMFITVLCAATFMVLKGIEYTTKWHHQAIRMKDFAIVEGHLAKIEEKDAKGHEVEADVVNVESSKISFSTLRFEKPWVADIIRQAGEKKAKITLATPVKITGTEEIKAGEELSISLLEKIQKAHIVARTKNGALRTQLLRDKWTELHAANPDKKDWQLAKDANIDPALLAGKTLPENPSITFNVSPAVSLWFPHRDIKEGAEQSRLKDDTLIDGKLLNSPAELHYVDAIDFRSVAMQAEKLGVEPEVAIKNTWLYKHNPAVQDAWAWNKEQMEKLQAKLNEKYKFNKDGSPKRVPNETERYRITWKDFVCIKAGKDKGDDGGLITFKEQFKGPDYATRNPVETSHAPAVSAEHGESHAAPAHKNENTFPHLSVPRDQIFLSTKFTPSWNTYYAIYFTMTALHGLHVIGGAIVLGYYLFRGKKMYDTNPEWLANRVEVGGLFWHFVDLVWIFLFPILYLM